MDNTASSKSDIIPSKKTFKFEDEQNVLLFFKKIGFIIFYFDCFIQTKIVDEKIPLIK